MSNVLIGIIGVILFIGLALAGALILGDDFRTSRATSEAAAIQQQLAQVASAYDMHRLKTGAVPTASPTAAHLRGIAIMSAMTPRFLRAMPENKRAESWWFFVDENGNPMVARPNIVMYNVVEDGGPARAVCDTVAEMAGMADAQGKAMTLGKPPLDRQQGCYAYEGGWGFATGLTGNYHFFRRI